MPEKKVPLEGEAKKRLRGYRSTQIVGVRLRPGDMETLLWLCEQLKMSKADVVKRALAVYAQQITRMQQ